jgi:hypothetical protein
MNPSSVRIGVLIPRERKSAGPVPPWRPASRDEDDGGRGPCSRFERPETLRHFDIVELE